MTEQEAYEVLGWPYIGKGNDGEIIEVIRVYTSAVWTVTNLVTKYFGWTEEAKKAGELFGEWGKH